MALFEGPELAEVVRGVERRVLDAGEPLSRRGEPADRLYVLTHGAIELSRPRGEVRAVAPHAVLGDLDVLIGEPYGATARAVGPAELLVVPREVLQRVTLASPRLARHRSRAR